MSKKQNHQANHKTAWFFWPLQALWNLLTWILEITGRLVLVILGFVFVLVGVMLSFTIVGATIGIPLAGLGILLVVRGLF